MKKINIIILFVLCSLTNISCNNHNENYSVDDINDSIEYVPNGKYTIYDVINKNLENEIKEYYEESVKCELEKELKRREEVEKLLNEENLFQTSSEPPYKI